MNTFRKLITGLWPNIHMLTWVLLINSAPEFCHDSLGSFVGAEERVMIVDLPNKPINPIEIQKPQVCSVLSGRSLALQLAEDNPKNGTQFINHPLSPDFIVVGEGHCGGKYSTDYSGKQILKPNWGDKSQAFFDSHPVVFFGIWILCVTGASLATQHVLTRDIKFSR